jgi:membrane-anchored protein YejM (alkaline phosphatase superfamily)
MLISFGFQKIKLYAVSQKVLFFLIESQKILCVLCFLVNTQFVYMLNVDSDAFSRNGFRHLF